MSIKKMMLVWDHSRARGSALLLMLALADSMNEGSGGVWLAVGTMARKTRIDHRRVHRLLRQLEDAGELERTAVPGTHGTTMYRLGNHYRQVLVVQAPPHPISSLSRESESKYRGLRVKGLDGAGATTPSRPSVGLTYGEWDTSED